MTKYFLILIIIVTCIACSGPKFTEYRGDQTIARKVECPAGYSYKDGQCYPCNYVVDAFLRALKEGSTEFLKYLADKQADTEVEKKKIESGKPTQ